MCYQKRDLFESCIYAMLWLINIYYLIRPPPHYFWNIHSHFLLAYKRCVILTHQLCLYMLIKNPLCKIHSLTLEIKNTKPLKTLQRSCLRFSCGFFGKYDDNNKEFSAICNIITEHGNMFRRLIWLDAECCLAWYRICLPNIG